MPQVQPIFPDIAGDPHIPCGNGSRRQIPGLPVRQLHVEVRPICRNAQHTHLKVHPQQGNGGCVRLRGIQQGAILAHQGRGNGDLPLQGGTAIFRSPGKEMGFLCPAGEAAAELQLHIAAALIQHLGFHPGSIIPHHRAAAGWGGVQGHREVGTASGGHTPGKILLSGCGGIGLGSQQGAGKFLLHKAGQGGFLGIEDELLIPVQLMIVHHHIGHRQQGTGQVPGISLRLPGVPHIGVNQVKLFRTVIGGHVCLAPLLCQRLIPHLGRCILPESLPGIGGLPAVAFPLEHGQQIPGSIPGNGGTMGGCPIPKSQITFHRPGSGQGRIRHGRGKSFRPGISEGIHDRLPTAGKRQQAKHRQQQEAMKSFHKAPPKKSLDTNSQYKKNDPHNKRKRKGKYSLAVVCLIL